VQPRAIPVFIAMSIAPLLTTGSVPGWAVQTGHIFLLGGSPKLVEQEQYILLFVFS
jgi:hypothetical protein